MPVYDIRLNAAKQVGGVVPAHTVPFGSVPFPRFNSGPGRLVDANGVFIPWAIRADTETGVVDRYERVNGHFVIEPGTMRLAVVRTLHPAPLRYVPVEEAEADPCHRVSTGRGAKTISSDPSG